MKTMLRLFTKAAAVLSLLIPHSTQAQAPAFDRATVCASGQGNYGWGPRKVVVDAQGNTYAAGTFNGTVALGNSLLTATQTPPNRVFPSDNFVAKLDPSGAYVWAVPMGDNQSGYVAGMTVDGTGDVYVTGGFDSYSMRFGAAGPVLYNSSAQGEGFVAKLSGATGQWLWARRVGGTGSDDLGPVAVNAAGDLYVVGGSGSAAATVGPFTLAGPQGFLAKFSSAGVWLWVRPLGNANASVSNMLLDVQGGIYFTGIFKAPSVSFGATTLTTQGVPGSPYATTGSELFVAKTDDAGNWLWAVQGDAVTHVNLISGFPSLASTLDGAGHLYIAGRYASTSARIGAAVLPNLSATYPPPIGPPLPVPYTNHRFNDAFVARLDAATGVWNWAVSNGGPGEEGTNLVAADGQGRVYACGNFSGVTPGGTTGALAQVDGATGAWRSVQPLGPINANALTLDGQSRLNMAGFFDSATATFGSVTLGQAGPGQSTGFVARLGAGPLTVHAPTRPVLSLQVWPNPAGEGGAAWVQGPSPGQAVQVLDALGRVVMRSRMPASGPLALPLPAALPAGLYVVRSAGQARRLVVE